jgi:hypothetical protein
MNKELITSLAKLAQVTDVAKFTAVLESESDTDHGIDFSNLIIRTVADDETLKTNLITQKKSEYQKAASEIQIKEMKKTLGLEFEGKKPEDFMTNFKKQVLDEAKIEPDKKIGELETSLSNLQGKLTDKETELKDLVNSHKKADAKIKLQSYVPKLSDKLGLGKDDVISLFLKTHEIAEDGSVTKDGKTLKDGVENNLDAKTVISDFVKEKKWDVAPSGGGGGAGGGGGGSSSLPTTTEEYETALKEKGFSIGSTEANALLAEIVKENPDF